MKKQIIITVYNKEDFLNALGEIKSNLDYDNIEYDCETREVTVNSSRVALAEIDSELFFDEISMDTKSWSFDYDDLEQNTKVFEYVQEYYPQELKALKNGEIDYLEVYSD